MNREQAKEILKRHRPGTADERDPEVARALQLAATDPELGRWLKQYQASQNSIRNALRRVNPPAGLREQIITEKPPPRTGLPRLGRRTWLTMTALALAAIFAVLLVQPQQTLFDRFQTRMVKTALRMYAMDLETSDPEQIRAFLAGAGAPANYELPDGLSQTPLTGCATLSFEGRPVSMICFQVAEELEPGAKSDLWLFVADSEAVSGLPDGSPPVFQTTGNAATASWTAGGATYLLVTARGEQSLRSLL